MPRNFPSQRQQKDWSAIGAATQDFTADATALLNSTSFLTSQTVLRLMGEILVFPTAAPVAGDDATITIGVGIVTADAAALGTTAMPDPQAEPNFPWLWWKSIPVGYNNASVTQGEAAAGASRVTWESKAMRRVKGGQAIAIIAQYGDLSGTPPITVVLGATRMLLGH